VFKDKLRIIDRLIALGEPLPRALQEAGLRGRPYLWRRAFYGGTRVSRMRDLYGRPSQTEREDVSRYVGRALSGLCPVCGQCQGFAAFSDNVRESGVCRACGASNRQRQMAYMLRTALDLGPDGPVRLPSGRRLHNTESTGALHAALLGAPGYSFSEYWGPEYGRGEIVQGIRNEDMQALSFADASLDLFMSSDVLEHMPSPYQAHAEVFRVLKPGGRHIFTVPFAPRPQDDVRARLVGGEIEYLAEKAYHGDPIRPEEGVLVWTVFGLEMLDHLRRIGFRPTLWMLCKPEFGIVGDAIVFEAYKPLFAWGAHRRRPPAPDAPGPKAG